MSFFTHFHRRGGSIFLRWVDDSGKRKMSVVKDFGPTIYLKTNEVSEFSTLAGDALKPIKLDSINEASDFIKRYDDVSGFELFGNTNWEYNYVNERWQGDIKYDPSKILTYFFDIETEVNGEFPDPAQALEKINVLTIFTGEIFKVWQLAPSKRTMEHPFPIESRHFSSELDMMKDFLQWWENNYPDVLSGWYSEGFDVPYVVNRLRRVLGDERAKALSPVGNIREYNVDKNRTSYEIKGIEHLDYQVLFKKFMFGERDNWTLDGICEDELGEQKLENPFSTFKEFYEKDWNRFVDYNIHDVSLLVKLDKKLNLLSLAYSIAYLVKMNFSDVFGTVKPWDIFIQNSLYKDKKFVSCKFSPGQADRSIMGGFVMTPVPGRYKWVVSFDANSLYPSIIRTWNISPETLLSKDEVPDELLKYYDRIQIDELLKDTTELTGLLKKYNLTMTANGHFFHRDRMGVMPLLSGMVYDGRVEAKNEMKKKKKALINETDPEVKAQLERDISTLDNKQMALKILLNSLYGAMANAYFRFFDFRNAEGITATGQYFIQKVAQMGSEYIDNLTGKKDSLIYIDTDSNYFSLNSLIEKANIPKGKEVDTLDKFCETKLGGKIDEACKYIGDALNVFDNQLAVKREKISESAVWVAKKRYALLVHDSEGLRYNTPDIAVTGLESKRSSIPRVCRTAISEAISIILSGTEVDLQEFVKSSEEDFMEMGPAVIATPSGVKGLTKYGDPKSIYKPGSPMHVRASLLYNHYLKTHEILEQYNPILEGGKMRMVKLRLPNPIGEDVIGFITELPKEFGLDDYIDYDELFNKNFISPVKKIAEACRWHHEKIATLDDFFS